MQTRLVDLVLNLLRKAQYQGTTPSADELYFITDDYGVTSADVTNALGYTPYNATNPNGYTSNIGTVTSVNGTQPDASGNVTIDVKGLYDYYTINANIVGTPTNTDCTISGFSASNYAYMGESLILPACWEFGFSFKTGTNGGTQYIIGNANASNNLYRFWLVGNSITLAIGSTNASAGNTLDSDTEYKVRVIKQLNPDYSYRGNYIYTYVYDKNETLLYNQTINVTGITTPLQCAFGATNSAGNFINPFDGSIDLKNVYFDSLLYDENTDSATATRLWTGVAPIIDTKANTDFSNLTDTADIYIAHASMPSSVYSDLTLGASGASYTAPAAGYVKIGKTATAANQYLSLSQPGYTNTFFSTGANNQLWATMPVAKGTTFNVNYNVAGTTQSFKFYYAQGSISEAS